MTKPKTKATPATWALATEAAILARVRDRRKMLDLSQAAAAKRIGWSPSAWADIERNRFRPKLVTLIMMAEALNCTTAHLCRV